MPYQSNLLGDFWTSYRQRRATGGRPLTSGEMRGLLNPMMEMEYGRSQAAAERERLQGNFNRQMSLQEQAVKSQGRASAISGLLQMPLMYGAAKQMGMLPQGFSMLNPSTWGGGAANAGVAGGLGAAANTLPVSAPAGAQSSVALAGEIGGGIAPGLLTTAGYGLIGGGAGLAASKVLGANEDISQALTLGGAGAGIGAAIGAGASVGGPVGAVIGGLIGVGASFLDDIF